MTHDDARALLEKRRAELLGEIERIEDQAIVVAIFRIYEEAMTNVSRHADAQNVSVHGRLVDHRLELEIADDGVGLGAPPETKRFGLVGMRERAAEVGGNLAMLSRPEGGTIVRVVVPVAAADATTEA